MAKIIIFILILTLAPLHILFGQTDESVEELENVKKITELTAEHEFLKSMAGEWKLLGLNKSSDEEIPLTGSAVINPIMNDHYLEMNLTVNDLSGSMESKVIIGFDTRINIFTLYSFDNITNYTNYSTGKRVDDKLTFKGMDYMIKYKKDVPFKIEINKERENKLTFRIFYTIDKKEKLMIDYQLIKKS